MMSLWERVKQAHPGAIVLFQNGDFYEIFQDNKKNADCDVDLACAILNVREAAGRSCRMAGVPVRTAGPHLGKLARAGHKLVLVEQSPDPDRPAQGGGGGKPKLIARRVTRVVTPGTLTDEEMLEPGSSNVLMAVSGAGMWTSKANVGVAYTDVSTGEPVALAVSTVAQLGDLIGRISPREVCLPRAALPGLRAFAEDLAKQGVFVTWLPEADSAPPPGTPAASREQELGLLEGAALRQLHAYVDQTLMPRGSAFRRGLVEKQQQAGKVLLHMDAATLQALEVVKGRNTGTAEGSLLQMVNKTVTAAGSRTLRARLAQPLLDPRAINARLDSVETLCRAPDARGASRKQLRKVRDVHRALQRLAIGRWTSADLVAIQDALTVSRTIADEVLWGAGLDPGLAEVCTVLSGVQPLPAERRNPAGERIVRDVTQAWSKARQRQLQTQDMLLPESLAFVPRSLADLETELSKALRSNGEQAPVAAAAGVKSQPPAGEAAPNEDEDAGSSAAAAPRVIQPGYSPALDAARQACDVDARIAALQVAYRQSTGLGGLRILKLRQAGRKAVQLVVHVPSAASQRVTLPGEFKWVQDLTSAKRFVTDELLALDQAAREAQQGVTEMEAELVQFLRGQVLSVQDAVKDLADALAQLDVAAGMAELASQSALTRPVVEPGLDLDIVQGRHIAVEKTRYGWAVCAPD
jgi:DNA mismatch repair ATPase MutS